MLLGHIDTFGGSLPVRTERIVYQPMLGDVALVTELADWKAVDGIQLPMRLTQRSTRLCLQWTQAATRARMRGACRRPRPSTRRASES